MTKNLYCITQLKPALKFQLYFFPHLTGFSSFTMNSVFSDNTQEGTSSVSIPAAISRCQATSSIPYRDSPPQRSRECEQTPRHASPDFQQKPNPSSCTCHRVPGSYHTSVWVANKATSCHPPVPTDRFYCCGQQSSSCCWELPAPAFGSQTCWSWQINNPKRTSQDVAIKWKMCCDS